MRAKDLIERLAQYAEDAPVMAQVGDEAFDIVSVDVDRVDGLLTESGIAVLVKGE